MLIGIGRAQGWQTKPCWKTLSIKDDKDKIWLHLDVNLDKGYVELQIEYSVYEEVKRAHREAQAAAKRGEGKGKGKVAKRREEAREGKEATLTANH